jgi:formate/nitrite transporter FocA (FNT family)
MAEDDDGGKEQEKTDGEKKPQKGYETILAQEIETGLSELERPGLGLLLSSLSAGMDVSFSLLLMAVMITLAEGKLPAPVVEILVANMYAAGYVFVILGRSELFTEHTTLAVLPVLDGKASLRQLGRLWGIIYAANLVGTGAFAAMVVFVAPALGIAEPWAFGKIAHGLVDKPSWVILVSAVLAGWLMGLLGWLIAASRDTIGQIVLVWLITGSIGILHLHHCIVGSAEVLAGVFAGQGIGLVDFARFLGLATVGNVAGGVIFVALIKYGHASRTAERTG